MSIYLEKVILPFGSSFCNAFVFLPAPNQALKPGLGLLTHGYTSHKGSLLNWATRLAEENMASILFDLPGHYLGGFGEVESTEYFQKNAHRLFIDAHRELLKVLSEHRPLDTHLFDDMTLVICGHSLGALLSLKALSLAEFADHQKQAVCVGLGLPPEGQTHLFNSSFYKSTLNIRGQLVAPELDPEIIFPWITKEKKELNLAGAKAHFITGLDDLVVGNDGTERLIARLEAPGNTLTIERPTKLPHHLPEMAAGHVKKYLKNLGLL